MTEQQPNSSGAQAPSLVPFYIIISAAGALATLGGLAWRGLDFALACLLGFVVVAANFIWTKNLIKGLLIDRTKSKPLLIISYFIKFGITAVVLYFALIHYRMDAMGILVGLSTLVVATFLYAWYAKPASQPETSNDNTQQS